MQSGGILGVQVSKKITFSHLRELKWKHLQAEQQTLQTQMKSLWISDWLELEAFCREFQWHVQLYSKWEMDIHCMLGHSLIEYFELFFLSSLMLYLYTLKMKKPTEYTYMSLCENGSILFSQSFLMTVDSMFPWLCICRTVGQI